jgi:hypothetical protein
MKKRTALLQTLREVFRRYRSQPVQRVVETINPILRGWVNYFAIGYSNRCCQFVKRWVEIKVRRHLLRARMMAAGLRVTAKAAAHPPEPKVGAPVLDPTTRRPAPGCPTTPPGTQAIHLSRAA